MPIGLLRNGHLDDLRPIPISRNLSLTLSNTCGYDSLIQLLACAYCDSDSFKQLVICHLNDSESANIVNCIVKEGMTKKYIAYGLYSCPHCF